MLQRLVKPTVVAPSILAADIGRLAEEVRAVDAPAPTGSMST